jgi:hypothetical protein
MCGCIRTTTLLLLVAAFLPSNTESFLTVLPTHASLSNDNEIRQSFPTAYDRTFSRLHSALFVKQEKKEVTYDGADRGRYLFALVFLICIWQFSIPPSFRRAKFCPSTCVKERSLCRTSSCVTFGEWTSDVVQYYRDGGGIQWDFSIDPKTLAENERFLQALFGPDGDESK